MKRVLLILLLCAGFTFAQTVKTSPATFNSNHQNGGKRVASSDTLSLYDINYLPPDSVALADEQGTAGRASLTDGAHLGDTVTVTGIVIADPGITINGTNQFSTGNVDFWIQSVDGAEWGGMNVFGSATTAAAIGLSSVDTGYVIQFTGQVTKYGADIMGNFELKPTADQPQIGLIDVRNRPAPVEVKVSDLVTGDLSAGGTMHFSPNVKYKNSYVILRNLIVKTRSQNSSTGQWSWTVEDSLGNTISVYDPSKYFTGRVWGVDPKYVPPAVGSKLAYIRGILATFSSYGYEIIPLYPGDVKINSYTPSITAVGFETRRSPSIPASSDPVTVRVTAASTNPDTSIKVDSAAVFYSVDNNAYTRVLMTPEATHTYSAVIPAQSDGAFVRYFYKAWCLDTLGNLLESMAPDTARAPLFYYVKDGGYRIENIQYTPFKDGISGAIDLPVNLKGVIQSDTTDYPIETDNRNQSKKPETPMVFMQDASAQWSGILLYDSLSYSLHKGDSVSVFGTVSEYSGWTEIYLDSVYVIQTGVPTHPPVTVKTGTVGSKPSGDPQAEPWESVLINFDSVTITKNDPDPSNSINSEHGSFREYKVSDGSGDCRVDDDGSNTYSVDPHDTAYGFTIMRQGSSIKSLTGTLVYTYGNYKLEPRTNSDFGEITGVKREQVPLPNMYSLSQNFPNPFNPSTTIRYTVPNAGKVTMKIYNILGQEVATIVNMRQGAGTYTVKFDASRLASGVYFYRLTAGSFNSVKKMMLLK